MRTYRIRRRAFLARLAAVGLGAVVPSRAGRSAERPSPEPGAAPAAARPAGRVPAPDNLLRNGSFQDDWLSLLPQNQTLHWTYLNTFFNRRDFNPDGWRCTGHWRWVDADTPRGSRRLVLGAPRAQLVQRLHWVAVHDEASITGSPDAGGFPALRPLYSLAPERLVRDLRLRVLIRGEAVPANAGGAELGLCPLGADSLSEPLGALYLRPEQAQLVRANLGLSAATMATLRSLRLEIVRRGVRSVLHAVEIPATPEAVTAQRARIPAGIRGDLANLLLADLDVSALPVQPFDDPQRNWVVRATALDRAGRPVAAVESEPFCRQAHEPPQPAIGQVTIGRDNLLRINGEPWIPWGAVYGFVPAYTGPADPGTPASRDLRALPDWSMYDRFTQEAYTRRGNDLNAARDVAGAITPRATIEQRWAADNLYASTAFVVPAPVFSTAALVDKAGGQAALDAYLDFCKRAPMVVSTAPGIEETFALFHTASAEELGGLRAVVEHLRRATAKPVMVGHGGYWNRLEFEKVPFFDIYDPETEPFFPANLHTDLWPLVQGQDKVIWLRPQIYEDVPYERWRFHVYVELMRGCRGWQMAHGPGDASLMRGLHGELERLKPILASPDPGPPIRIEPWIEHWARRHNGKTYLIGATTRGIAFGRWRPGEDAGAPAGPSRITEATAELRDEANVFGLGGTSLRGYAAHGIQYLPSARAWPAGSRLVQWVRLDAASLPRGFAILVKADGRFTHAAAWGGFDPSRLRGNPALARWFLRTFYRHATGFLGWDLKGLPASLQYIPGATVEMGASPPPGAWTRLEVPLERIRADRKLLDGVGFLHAGGRLRWGRTSIVAPGGEELLVWGDSDELAPDRLARTTITVGGLRAGTRVRVLFEDRALTAADGFFVDDFRGRDLYQRFGGGPMVGYGDAPVTLHVYEIG